MSKTMQQIIKELQQDSDLNQKQVAAYLAIDPSLYYKYENGIQPWPLRHVIKLAELYKVSLDYITGRTNSQAGLEGLNQNLLKDYSVGEMISDVLAMNEEDRRHVVKTISILKAKKA